MVMLNIADFPRYETYKNSGYEWIGEVPEKWEVSKLGGCLSAVSIKGYPNLPLLSITREQGVIQRDVEDQDSNHNFIPDDLSGYKLLKKGQFGMNKMKAWQGSYGVSKYTGIVSPAYFIFDFTKPIWPSFFNWAIRSNLYVSYFGSASDGVRVGQWDLSKDRMKVIPFLLPSEGEQKLIAKFLDKKAAQIEEAIAIKEQQIALLKERKQIIIQKAVTQGLDPNVSVKESGVPGLGYIPKHWGVIFNRRLFKEKSRPVKGDELALSLSQVDGVVKSGDMKERSLSPSHRKNFKLVFRGDLVVNRFKGHLGVFFESAFDGIVTFHYGVFESSPEVYTRYYQHLFHTEAYKIIYAGASNGMTVGLQNLSNQNFYAVKSPLPPYQEQVKISEYIDSVERNASNIIDGIHDQILALKEYKTTLINSAVTGKIKITPDMVEG